MELFNTMYGYFLGDYCVYYTLGCCLAGLVLGYTGIPFFGWTLLGLIALYGFAAPLPVLWVFLAFAVIFNVHPIRRLLVTSFIRKLMAAMKVIPKISNTERTALDAGVVWVEGDLFSGKPNLTKMINEPYPQLTPEEKAFVDGPCEKLCSMIEEWKITKERDIPEEVMNFIRKEKFLGMIIPKQYGGLGFSALAHSEVIHKLASRSIAVTVTVMVPNSLGPAELLVHYGTEEQKKYYLPRLAAGQEMPCFALTEPGAGSDAGSIESRGDLFKGKDGKLYVRLNWNKRYITLASISTLLGLAFRLKDPENILGRGEGLGITCALIPTNLPGVVIGRRHDPLGVPFYNCPTQGHDVVVPADALIGGTDMAGQGWKMLMETLAAGRGISLPAQSTGGSKLVARVVGDYAVLRQQFGTNIGRFEGIQEPMGRIGGMVYLLEAMRKYTLGALDKGIKPPVITAIAKYNATELCRKIINDGLDVVGGAGISRGPRNLLAEGYCATPIGITVEGANILTRTLMIFGQGAMRAHPYAYKEVKTFEENDLAGFDSAFWGHIGHVVRNSFRSILLSLTRGRLAPVPVSGPTAGYFRKLAWASATFAIMSDIAMGSLGGALKVKEKITGRFADILSWMYMGFAVLRRWEAEGQKKDDLPFVHFAMQHSFIQIQNAFDGIFANLQVPLMGWLFKGPIRVWASLNSLGRQIPDEIGNEVAKLMQTNPEVRDRLTDGIYLPKDPQQALGRLEKAFKSIATLNAAEKTIRKYIAGGVLPKKKPEQLYEEALNRGILSPQEYQLIKEATLLRWDAVQVDDFSQEEYLGLVQGTGTSARKPAPPVSKQVDLAGK